MDIPNAPARIIVAFNSPPRSGKDTIAQLLKSSLYRAGMPVSVKSISTPLRRGVMELLGLEYSDVYYEQMKDNIILNELTFREIMIQMAEEYIRPKFGKDVFAKTLLRTTLGWGEVPQILIVPDLGFTEEASLFENNSSHFALIHLYREGFADWKNDSRRLVNPPIGTPLAVCNTEGNPSMAVSEIIQQLSQRWPAII